MEKDEKIISELYNNIFTSSPKRTIVNIPDDVGNGSITCTTTKRGIYLSTFRFDITKSFTLTNNIRGDFVNIWYCFGDSVSWVSKDDKQKVHTLKEMQAFVYVTDHSTEKVFYEKGKSYYLRNIKIPLTYYWSLLNRYFTYENAIRCTDILMKGYSFKSITPKEEHIFNDLKDYTQFQNGLGYLYLESKVHELMAVFFTDIFEMNIVNVVQNRIIRQDNIDAVMKVKKIIDNSLEDTPNRDELARSVGMSPSMLGSYFSKVIGTSIHAYVVDQRLEKAASLLLESDYLVGDIANKVGYTKASNFSAAFKKKFGVLPKEYRNQLIMKQIQLSEID